MTRPSTMICTAILAAATTGARPCRAEDNVGTQPRRGGDVANDSQTSDQWQAEALDVQRRMGGPLANQFEWLAPETPAAPYAPWRRQFRGTLALIADGPVPERPAPTATTPRIRALPTWWTPAPHPVTAAAAEIPIAVQDASRVGELRGTAVQLETLANRLEELELYEQSDAMRDVAQRLRKDARRELAASREQVAPAYGTSSVDATAQWLGPVPDDGPRGSMPQRHAPGWGHAADEAEPVPQFDPARGGASTGVDAVATDDDSASAEPGPEEQERSVLVEPAPE